MRRLFLNCSLALVVVFAQCKQSTVESTLVTGNGRIEIGKHIDKIQIGDDTTTVQKYIGPPKFIGYGDFDGFIYAYACPSTQGPGFVDTTLVTFWGTYPTPDTFRVAIVSVLNSYTGSTSDGVAIGSNRAFVFSRLGQPDTTYQSASDIVDYYPYHTCAFRLTYKSSTLSSIHMGSLRIK